jgi:hypothetical protein
MVLKTFFLLILMFLFTDCEKEKLIYLDNVKSIEITKSIYVDNGFKIHDHVFNYITYNNFLNYLSSSDRFLIVQQKDLEKTTSKDKVIISLRHDVDDNINSAIKFAYLEKKYGIQSTYFILHTARYYGETKINSFKRNNDIIYYIEKVQNTFGHEIGWHNDLVTLQIVYNLDSREFLKNELMWLRGNNINILGSSSHGSGYCYTYHYTNAYFWKEYQTGNDIFFNFETVPKDGQLIQIEKDNYPNYNFEYETGLIKTDYFFADVINADGKRWHMGMVDLDTIQPGKKVVILLHPEHWD